MGPSRQHSIKFSIQNQSPVQNRKPKKQLCEKLKNSTTLILLLECPSITTTYYQKKEEKKKLINRNYFPSTYSTCSLLVRKKQEERRHYSCIPPKVPTVTPYLPFGRLAGPSRGSWTSRKRSPGSCPSSGPSSGGGPRSNRTTQTGVSTRPRTCPWEFSRRTPRNRNRAANRPSRAADRRICVGLQGKKKS